MLKPAPNVGKLVTFRPYKGRKNKKNFVSVAWDIKI